MSEKLARQRFHRFQFYAGLLLLVFLAQALWLLRIDLLRENSPDPMEAVRVTEGWKQWHGDGIAGAPFTELSPDMNFGGSGAPSMQAERPFGSDQRGFDTEHAPLIYLISAAPLLGLPGRVLHSGLADSWRWLPSTFFIACGLFLGASLWYVARRLCGNEGGLLAVALYCFSPGILKASTAWHMNPGIFAAWGAFGTIFTAIAVAHTLYAPREVVLWNWRRIVLLGISLAIAIGALFPMIIVVPMALAFLLYVAPVRKRAGLVIWLAACAVGFILLFAQYFFQWHVFVTAMDHAQFWKVSGQGLRAFGVYKQAGLQLVRNCPLLAVGVPLALITYVIWLRTRYFGNTAPLLVAVVFVVMAIVHPETGAEFLLTATPFLFLFVAGVLADLMETQQRLLVTASVFGIVAAYALWNLLALVQAARA